MKSQLHLGASLYVPATHSAEKLVPIGDGQKFTQLRSVIFCTEDAVREDQVATALHNLKKALPRLSKTDRPMRFIRVRNPHILGRCIAMEGIQNIDGFVLPKLTPKNFNEYLSQLSTGDNFSLMPTLETIEVFNEKYMDDLREMILSDNRAKSRVMCLRIGGNDLLHLMRVRREPRHTIYDTPVGYLISRLATQFIPYGIGLTAPVFEAMSHPDTLKREVELDLLHGLFGKTAIHPDQIQLIENGFAVNPDDLAEAERILTPDAPAVFRLGGRMCEPTTHSRWAQDVVDRSKVYGVRKTVATTENQPSTPIHLEENQ